MNMEMNLCYLRKLSLKFISVINKFIFKFYNINKLEIIKSYNLIYEHQRYRESNNNERTIVNVIRRDQIDFGSKIETLKTFDNSID